MHAVYAKNGVTYSRPVFGIVNDIKCPGLFTERTQNVDPWLQIVHGAQSAPDVEERTACDLTAFQQTILTVLSEKSQYDLAIKRELEDYYGNEVNHGRLYLNLDELVEGDLIVKSELDKRTNEYELTDDGYELLLGQLNWEFSKIVTGDERADEKSVPDRSSGERTSSSLSGEP